MSSRFLNENFDKEKFISGINQKIQNHGAIILPDGQFLNRKIAVEDIIDYQIGECGVQVFERKKWQSAQKIYFKIDNPYQLAEEVEAYSYSWALIDTEQSYLEADERILAILHGVQDNTPFYCACNLAEVVYTSFLRFVCMSCNRLHTVLADRLEKSYKQSLMESEWFDYFDPEGSKNIEEIELELVNF